MRWRSAAPVAVAISTLTVPAGAARAVMSNEPSVLAPSDDTDYAAGKAAFNAGDWRGAIANLTLVLIRRPWHDNAETMVAYSWRKLGDYDQALAHYATAPPAYSSLRHRLAGRGLRGGGGWTRMSGWARARRGAPATPAETGPRPSRGGGCRRGASGRRCSACCGARIWS